MSWKYLRVHNLRLFVMRRLENYSNRNNDAAQDSFFGHKRFPEHIYLQLTRLCEKKTTDAETLIITKWCIAYMSRKPAMFWDANAGLKIKLINRSTAVSVQWKHRKYSNLYLRICLFFLSKNRLEVSSSFIWGSHKTCILTTQLEECPFSKILVAKLFTSFLFSYLYIQLELF